MVYICVSKVSDSCTSLSLSRLPAQRDPCSGGHVGSSQHRSHLELHVCRLWSQCKKNHHVLCVAHVLLYFDLQTYVWSVCSCPGAPHRSTKVLKRFLDRALGFKYCTMKLNISPLLVQTYSGRGNLLVLAELEPFSTYWATLFNKQTKHRLWLFLEWWNEQSKHIQNTHTKTHQGNEFTAAPSPTVL